MSLEQLAAVRMRMMPMIRAVAQEYSVRTPDGYPNIVDSVETGSIGIEIDPSYALYVVSDGDGLSADMYYRSSRNDTRSSASREKFSGAPFNDVRPLPDDPDDLLLRNLLAELMSRFNIQPGLIHITDS